MKMYTARKKIQKDKGIEPSEFEDAIAWAANNLVAATAVAPSVLACRAPTADTPSRSVSCYVIRVLPSGCHRRRRTRCRRHGRGQAVSAFVFFPRREELRIQTRRQGNCGIFIVVLSARCVEEMAKGGWELKVRHTVVV